MDARVKWVLSAAAVLVLVVVAAPGRSAAADPAQQERDRAAQEKANLLEDIAMAKKSEAKERAAREQMEKQLTDAKARIQQLEKEKADRERASRDEKQNLLQDQAMARKGEAKERAERERLAKEKIDRDKQLADAQKRLQQLEGERPERERQLADAKARLQQLEREKGELDKQLAATKEREKNEREAHERLEKARQAADSERQERDKLAEGPDLPSRIPEPLTCNVPDEAPAGKDLFVHCLAQGAVAARTIVFHYRPNGTVVYNAMVMDRSRKGWYAAMIPAGKLKGKLVQYYAEARDGGDSVVATNGKASSPNVMTLRPAAAATPTSSSETSPSSGSTRRARFQR